MRRLALLAISMLWMGLSVSGCARSDAWVEFAKSGGLGNVRSTVTVTRDGSVTVNKREGSSTFVLSSDQRQRLEAALASAKSAPSAPSSGARDAYRYVLTVDGNSQSWDDRVEPRELAPVREFFEAEAGI